MIYAVWSALVLAIGVYIASGNNGWLAIGTFMVVGDALGDLDEIRRNTRK